MYVICQDQASQAGSHEHRLWQQEDPTPILENEQLKVFEAFKDAVEVRSANVTAPLHSNIVVHISGRQVQEQNHARLPALGTGEPSCMQDVQEEAPNHP
jgi:hypothetical protein